jgi:hypothetical protein
VTPGSLVPWRSLGRDDRQRGQILVLFVVALVAILWMLRLLIDGASAITHRRAMQDASDAAALAGANVITGHPCSSMIDEVRIAAQASLEANGWGADRATAVIECADGWNDEAVRVSLQASGPSMFTDAIGITVDSTAINGTRSGGAASVITLHPSRCDAFYLNGNVSLTFDGSVHVNSGATPGDGGCTPSQAAATGKGGSSQITLLNGASMAVHGAWSNISTNPPPSKGGVMADPFAAVDEPADRPDLFPLKSDPPTKTVKQTGCKGGCTNEAIIVAPGIYTKQKSFPKLSSGNYLVFLPGVYIFDNVILENNGGTMCTLPQEDPAGKGSKAWTYESVAAGCGSTESWTALCSTLADQRDGAARCGALLSFDGFATCNSKSKAPNIIDVGGSSATLLRPYLSGAGEDEDIAKYDGFLLWFSRNHAADPGCTANLRGGAGSQFSGVIYGPTTNISMAGGGTGSAGALTLQMVVSTVEYKGGSIFTFHYESGELSTHAVYGLVE